MKKFTIALLALFFVTSVVLVGCGKKKESTGAEAILKKSQAVADDIKSLRASGDAVINTPESEVQETKMTFEMEGNIISETEVNAKITAIDEDGKRTDAYIVDGWAYSYSPTTGWVKQKVEDAQDFGAGALMTPNQISELSKYAEELKQLPDEGNNYVLSFKVGTRFFEQAFQGAEEAAGGSAPTDQETLEMAKALLKGLNMTMTMKIDKTTHFPSETRVSMSAETVPILGKMDVSLTMRFTDYNKPVDVTLPAEAQAARELPPGAGGLPSLPGLGL